MRNIFLIAVMLGLIAGCAPLVGVVALNDALGFAESWMTRDVGQIDTEYMLPTHDTSAP